MTAGSLPLYRDINQKLIDSTLSFHPSQLHGLICGIISAHQTKKEDWQAWLAGNQEMSAIETLLAQIYEVTEKQLAEFLFEFQLLLPTDTETLPDRAEALTVWCQGFLTGLDHSGIKSSKRLNGEAAEAMDDITEIAKMNYDEVVTNEEDEAAYAELVEYVRMAVILIYQTRREEVDKTRNQAEDKRLH